MSRGFYLTVDLKNSDDKTMDSTCLHIDFFRVDSHSLRIQASIKSIGCFCAPAYDLVRIKGLNSSEKVFCIGSQIIYSIVTEKDNRKIYKDSVIHSSLHKNMHHFHIERIHPSQSSKIKKISIMFDMAVLFGVEEISNNITSKDIEINNLVYFY